MQDFITDAAAKLGISTGQAESAAGGLLGFIKEQADGADFGELLGKLPGAGDLLAKAEGREAGGGLLGGLGDAVGDLLGGGAEQALGMAGLVGKLGLDADKLGGFLELFTKYVQPLLGTDLLKRLAAKIPGLGDLISGRPPGSPSRRAWRRTPDQSRTQVSSCLLCQRCRVVDPSMAAKARSRAGSIRPCSLIVQTKRRQTPLSSQRRIISSRRFG